MTDPVIRKRNRANKRKGAMYEVALVKYWRDAGWQADRISKKGRGDEGDVAVTLDQYEPEVLLIEAKDEARHNFSGYLAEAEAEALHYKNNREPQQVLVHPIAVVKRRGKPVNESYVVMTLDALQRLLS